ncbi:MAG: methyltransferase domain-containing protein [Candidatus Zixiibacteriota bacterium]|nr:MAG: methyltransferase domain-containing protein [candidate division Zixibacteria bacterium]
MTEHEKDREARLRQVRQGYEALLQRSRQNPVTATAVCCGYTREQVEGLPPEAVAGSFGCGNPLKLSAVGEGQTVLDIGSGAGIDCFLAAGKVGPGGRVIGLDVTPAMIEQAAATAAERGYANVEFRLGAADRMPVDDASVDWIISNCVINLAPDKPAVFREMVRVLKPGGRVAISDIVLTGSLPPEIRTSAAAWIGCLAGAIDQEEYLEGLRRAGLEEVEVVSRFAYDATGVLSLFGEGAEKPSCGCGCSCAPRAPQDRSLTLLAGQLAGKVWSADIRAVKPLQK